MLKIENLKVNYGYIEAIHGITINVDNDSIVSLIGSNGAGKSSLLKAISGMVDRSGMIEWNGTDITKLNSVKIAKLGIMHVPEGRQVFPGLTVLENLETGCINWHGYFGKLDIDNDLELVYGLFPILKSRSKQLAWSLSGGEQQMLAIGRALMGRPKILLLDEPSMGLAPLVIDELFDKIIEINKSGIPILMVEQNARKALKVSKYAYIMSQGKIVLQGDSSKLLNDEKVVANYFGNHWKRKVN